MNASQRITANTYSRSIAHSKSAPGSYKILGADIITSILCEHCSLGPTHRSCLFLGSLVHRIIIRGSVVICCRRSAWCIRSSFLWGRQAKMHAESVWRIICCYMVCGTSFPFVLGDEWSHPPATGPSTYHGNGRSLRPCVADASVS